MRLEPQRLFDRLANFFLLVLCDIYRRISVVVARHHRIVMILLQRWEVRWSLESPDSIFGEGFVVLSIHNKLLHGNQFLRILSLIARLLLCIVGFNDGQPRHIFHSKPIVDRPLDLHVSLSEDLLF